MNAIKTAEHFKIERRENYSGMPDDWLIRETRKDHVNCCEFKTEAEARAAAERWNNGDGIAVFETWVAPPEDADESHRGWYLIHVRGSEWWTRFGGGWHQDAASSRVVTCLRDAVANYGLGVVQEILNAVADRRFYPQDWKHSQEQAARFRALS